MPDCHNCVEHPNGKVEGAASSGGIPVRPLPQAIKRSMDVSVAALALVLLLPLLGLIYVLVLFGDGPPAIFRQPRIGQQGRTFVCLKFRTMVLDSDTMLAKHLARSTDAREEWERSQKLVDDPRVTPLGRFLRETSLDELPQLVNVLLGEMSLVGPRPILATEVDRYGSAFAACFSMPPGITGLWQVSGRAELSFAERVKLDLAYTTSWRLSRDLSILARTVPAVLAQRGSY